VQKAFVYSYEESAKTLLDNYLDNVEAYCNMTKIRDPITGEELDPDEKLMRSIEEQIGILRTPKRRSAKKSSSVFPPMPARGKSSTTTATNG